MVGSAPQSQSQSQSQSQPPSAEEEALKRNTDCVYFLASPLTCKKGSECEYRHSDIARVNPRDCWFWLHGNCLNPKCGFRHPAPGTASAAEPATIKKSFTGLEKSMQEKKLQLMNIANLSRMSNNLNQSLKWNMLP
ncbi:UNVERIFIED_CONTAM: Zinc finger CCCH domain-containing protein 17 [Sesamum radiatum]|uniref:Zinc finger CCCH domain-containing protein 17 n=1 Tax=Sesamum radiatum TaxID=300843 RepID=A0AAW2U011_SESRA